MLPILGAVTYLGSRTVVLEAGREGTRSDITESTVPGLCNRKHHNTGREASGSTGNVCGDDLGCVLAIRQ